MKKTLYFNENEYNIRLKSLLKVVDQLQSFMDEFYKMNLFKISKMHELKEVIEHPESYIKKRIAENINVPIFGLFKMKKESLMETLDLPSFEKLKQLAEPCKYHSSYFRYFNLEGKVVVLNNDELIKLKESYSIIAETKDHVFLHEAHMRAAVALEELNKGQMSVLGVGLDPNNEIKKYFLIRNGKIVQNEEFYSTNRSYLFKSNNN